MVKKEMRMMPNGNYEEHPCNIQHECWSEDLQFRCVEYGWKIGKLELIIEAGNLMKEGFGHNGKVNFCPICGYKAKYQSNQTCRHCENPEAYPNS